MHSGVFEDLVILRDERTKEDLGVYPARWEFHKDNWYVNLPAVDGSLNVENKTESWLVKLTGGNGVVEIDKVRAGLLLFGLHPTKPKVSQEKNRFEERGGR